MGHLHHLFCKCSPRRPQGVPRVPLQSPDARTFVTATDIKLRLLLALACMCLGTSNSGRLLLPKPDQHCVWALREMLRDVHSQESPSTLEFQCKLGEVQFSKSIFLYACSKPSAHPKEIRTQSRVCTSAISLSGVLFMCMHEPFCNILRSKPKSSAPLCVSGAGLQLTRSAMMSIPYILTYMALVLPCSLGANSVLKSPFRSLFVLTELWTLCLSDKSLLNSIRISLPAFMLRITMKVAQNAFISKYLLLELNPWKKYYKQY